MECRLRKGDRIMAKKLFTTIYGRNLVGELKNIVQRPYLVVTMEDLWDQIGRASCRERVSSPV